MKQNICFLRFPGLGLLLPSMYSNEWSFKEQELEARRAQVLQEIELKKEAHKESVCHVWPSVIVGAIPAVSLCPERIEVNVDHP